MEKINGVLFPSVECLSLWVSVCLSGVWSICWGMMRIQVSGIKRDTAPFTTLQRTVTECVWRWLVHHLNTVRLKYSSILLWLQCVSLFYFVDRQWNAVRCGEFKSAFNLWTEQNNTQCCPLMDTLINTSSKLTLWENKKKLYSFINDQNVVPFSSKIILCWYQHARVEKNYIYEL